jgi:dTDP-4-dehydrorhamnose 3,5-epimerase
MSIRKNSTAIPGCFELQPPVLADSRGAFVKTFREDWFAELGLRTAWVEQYYSVSKRRVLRGLHFQLPPHDHAKLVYCTAGEVMDVAVDLRVGSPSFGQHACVTLSSTLGNMVYLDVGLAHGFYTLSDNATLVYNVTSVYAPRHDCGIRWDSVDVPWPDKHPALSDRDSRLVPFKDFASPFSYRLDFRRDDR